MRNTIQSLFALVIVLLFCYGCQKKADAVTTGATTYNVRFATHSSSNMNHPIRPCVDGQATYRTHPTAMSVQMFFCASTVTHGRHWYRVGFANISAK